MLGSVNFERFPKYFAYAEHCVVACVGLATLNILLKDGFSGVARDFVRFARKLPAVNTILKAVLAGEVKGFVRMLNDDKTTSGKSFTEKQVTPVVPIPEKGISPEIIAKKLVELYGMEKKREDGKGFAYTYMSNAMQTQFLDLFGQAYDLFSEPSGAGNKAHDKIVHEAWKIFMHTNAINPTCYLALRSFETEVLSMTAWMLNGDGNVAGTLTSGGTESVLMAVKTYRDRARKLSPHITKPNIVAPITVHPAFEKAAHYFNVEVIHVALTADYRVNVKLVAEAIDENTILLVGSAPQYCHGVVDPIEELSDLALSKGLPLHVDACFGGFMLPWLEKLGESIPKFDFRVPGVTSISADLHKYGYSPRGASIVLYRNSEIRSHQFFAYPDWPGGLFGSAAMAGSRPGGIIASSWTAMVAMGQEGYLNFAKDVLAVTKRILQAVDEMEGIRLVTRPDMTSLAIMSDSSKVNILALADVMDAKGWSMERQQYPDSLHMSIVPLHIQSVDQLITDLKSSVREVLDNPNLVHEGTVGIYGMIAKIPDNTIVNEFIINLFSELYKVDQKSILG